MGRLSGKKPSPAMVTSIVALVFAVAGTSVAGVATISVLNKKEKKQTSKIAKKEIKKAAPGLSVANADKLDGKDASQLQTTSAYAERTSGDFPLTASFQEVVTTSVTTTGTRIVATASLELDANGAGGDTAHCRLRIAGVESSTYDQQSLPVESTMALTFARTVQPGTHAVGLECSETGTIVDVDAALSVVAVGE